MMRSGRWSVGLCAIALVTSVAAQEPPTQFGGEYAGLDARRQQLIADWVGRFNEVTGQTSAAAPFYDSQVRMSARTTFDAVTNALMRTSLTDAVRSTDGRRAGSD